MFDQVFESYRKATETTVQMQQEMFKKWVALWPGTPMTSPVWGDQLQQFQKKWGDFVNDLLKRQRNAADIQLKAGIDNIEQAFKLGEVKSAEELRAKVIELWHMFFDGLRQTYEAQVADFQAALEKWAQLLTKPAA